MPEYIEREALLKNLKENHDDFMTDPTIDKRIKWRESLCYYRVLKTVYKTPLVSKGEIVRCKDCKFWGASHNRCSVLSNILQDGFIQTSEDFFCALAERKSDNTDVESS